MVAAIIIVAKLALIILIAAITIIFSSKDYVNVVGGIFFTLLISSNYAA